MLADLARLCACIALLLVAACASPVHTSELSRIDEHSGYRYTTLDQKVPKTIDKSAVIMSFSGGGTRAAALADGALRALAATAVQGSDGRVPLASQIDVVSSVPGGSVTAAYFALGGIDGLTDFEQNFLYTNVMDALIERTSVNPLQLFYPRIDILDDYLDDHVFANKTYRDLIVADNSGRNHRPYVILNAADMASGNVFSFTQDQFDLICGDLRDLSIAPFSLIGSTNRAMQIGLHRRHPEQPRFDKKRHRMPSTFLCLRRPVQARRKQIGLPVQRDDQTVDTVVP